jgi:hypothetical protein
MVAILVDSCIMVPIVNEEKKMKIVVSREFCGRRVITVGKDERSYHARTIGGRSYSVYYKDTFIGNTDKVRAIESIVADHNKSLAKS